MAAITSAAVVAGASVYSARSARKNAKSAAAQADADRQYAREVNDEAQREANKIAERQNELAEQRNAIAEEANRVAQETAAAQLAWEQQQLDDWELVYGGLEDNLSEYYNTLSANDLAVEQLQALSIERSTALDTVKTQLAQRGIQSSGLSAQLDLESALQTSRDAAQIRVDSPREVARQKQDFLTLGLSKNPENRLSNVYSNQTAQAYNVANRTSNEAYNAESRAFQAETNALPNLGFAERQANVSGQIARETSAASAAATSSAINSIVSLGSTAFSPSTTTPTPGGSAPIRTATPAYVRR